MSAIFVKAQQSQAAATSSALVCESPLANSVTSCPSCGPLRQEDDALGPTVRAWEEQREREREGAKESLSNTTHISFQSLVYL